MAIITIGGKIGAGKTTLAKRLAEELGYDELHIGHIFRELAREKDMPIEEFYAALGRDPDIERAVDRQQADFMKLNDDIVMQGRMAWFFAKESPFPAFNIFLTVDPEVGAERSGKRKENLGKSVREMIAQNAKREATENERYEELYGIEDFQSPGHYDLVLDTSTMSEEQVLKHVLEAIHERMGGDV